MMMMMTYILHRLIITGKLPAGISLLSPRFIDINKSDLFDYLFIFSKNNETKKWTTRPSICQPVWESGSLRVHAA